MYDTAKENRNNRAELNVDMVTLQRAYHSWNSLETFREQGKRSARFVYGDQWKDRIKDIYRGSITERDLIEAEGNIPFQNNRLAPMVRSILGQFSQNSTEPICVPRNKEVQDLGDMMSATLQYVYQHNKLWELDRRGLESFVITGLCAYRSYYGFDSEEDITNVWTDLVNYNRIFFHGYNEDPRHKGLDLIGEIHDLPLQDLIAEFSFGDIPRAKRLKEIYSLKSDEYLSSYMEQLTDEKIENLSFMQTSDNTCRVIEVWTKEAKERVRCHDVLNGVYYIAELEDIERIDKENRQRFRKGLPIIEMEYTIDRYWMCHFLAPTGEVLFEGESPYEHRGTPYSIKIYPFFDGIARSFITDAIDIQKHINRLIIMQDFVQKSSAKGVLMMPEDALPDNMSMKDIATEWKKHDGIIYYKPKVGMPAPHQIINNASGTGVYDLLSVQLKMLDDVSGVSGALQGQQARANTPASLYAMQSQNSAIMLTDLMESFTQLREDRDKKNMKLILQFFDTPRYIGISGGDNRSATMYDPDKIKDIEFDLSLGESTSTQVYRAIQNDFLMQLFQMQAIDLRTLLENSTMAYSSRLLESVDRRQREQEEQQQQMAQQQQVAPPQGEVPQELGGIPLEIPQELQGQG